jgi:cation:H+ antiporter
MAATIILVLILIVSLIALVKGADVLVKGASNISSTFKVPPILIGLTVVAFGTSLPEFIVSLISVFVGSPDLSVGNIIGSNIANIGLGIGIAALFVSLAVKTKTIMYEFPFLLVSTLLLLILGNNAYLFQQNTFSLTRFDGIVMWVIFAIFLYYVLSSALSSRKNKSTTSNEFEKEYKDTSPEPIWKSSLFILAGILLLALGGKFFVDASSEIAFLFGLSEAFIGLTIVAIGTSLPDIITTVVAAVKGEREIAVGNVVGSNIFNIFFVLGTVSLLKPIGINPSLLLVDGIVMLVLTILFLVFATRGKNINRWEGVVLILSYIAYMAYLIAGL